MTTDGDVQSAIPTVATAYRWPRRSLLGAAVFGAVSAIAAAAYLLGPAQLPQAVSASRQTSGPSSTPPASATGSPIATPLAGSPAGATTATGEIVIVGQQPPIGGNPGPGTSRPVAPSGVSATATSPTGIRLQWKDNASDETGFVLFRLGGEQIQLGPNTTSYEWAGLSMSQHHCFAVGVYNGAGWASEPFPPPSVADWSCADTPGLPPAAPSGLTAQPVSGTSIVLRWKDNSSNESYFKILVADGEHHQIGGYPIANGGTSYPIEIARNVEAGVEYCFQIQAVNSAGPSAWTPWSCTFSLPVPAIPASFTATAVDGGTVRLEWADTSAIETVFKIYRLGRLLPMEVAANTTSYAWTGLTPGTEYCFRMNAVNAAGYYANTPQLCVTTPVA